MTDQERKAMDMALDALDSCEFDYDWEERPYKTFDEDLVNDAVDALRKALDHVPEPDMGIDRGAWDDVPDATKWVDELRGGDETEQEPVAWMYDFLNTDNRDEVIRNWITQDTADIEREKGFNVRPLYAAPPSKPDDIQAVIAGVLFDFMGWLTSRKDRLVLSSTDDASPAVKVIEEFAKMRGLSLDDAKVKDWQDITAPPSKPWVSLTDEERSDVIGDIFGNIFAAPQKSLSLARAIEAKLKEKNGL